MSRSKIDQSNQISNSIVYDGSVASPHTSAVAEGQTTLEGDLNVIRTNIKDLKGSTYWWDDVIASGLVWSEITSSEIWSIPIRRQATYHGDNFIVDGEIELDGELILET